MLPITALHPPMMRGHESSSQISDLLSLGKLDFGPQFLYIRVGATIGPGRDGVLRSHCILDLFQRLCALNPTAKKQGQSLWLQCYTQQFTTSTAPSRQLCRCVETRTRDLVGFVSMAF